MTRPKFVIFDDSNLREDLDIYMDSFSNSDLCQFSKLLIKHMLELVNYSNFDNPLIRTCLGSFKINSNGVNTNKIRRVGQDLKIFDFGDEKLNGFVSKGIYECVATHHFRSHALIASDYCVKIVNVKHPRDMAEVVSERNWQIKTLKSLA